MRIISIYSKNLIYHIKKRKKLNNVKKIAKFLIIKESEGIKNSIKE